MLKMYFTFVLWKVIIYYTLNFDENYILLEIVEIVEIKLLLSNMFIYPYQSIFTI